MATRPFLAAVVLLALVPESPSILALVLTKRGFSTCVMVNCPVVASAAADRRDIRLTDPGMEVILQLPFPLVAGGSKPNEGRVVFLAKGMEGEDGSCSVAVMFLPPPCEQFVVSTLETCVHLPCCSVEQTWRKRHVENPFLSLSQVAMDERGAPASVVGNHDAAGQRVFLSLGLSSDDGLVFRFRGSP